MSIKTDIARYKKSLAKKQSCENLGQKEVRTLKDKYDYNSLVYGTQQEREQAQLISNFDEWCMNYTG